VFSLKDEIKTGQDYLRYLEEVFGVSTPHPDALKFTKEAWNKWEKQGTSQPNNIQEIASDPLHTYRIYYQDILIACPIENIKPDSVYFSLLPLKNLNAYANTTTNQDKVIVFDEDLITFFTAFIIAVMIAVYTDTTDLEVEFFDRFILARLEDFYSLTKSRTEASNKQYTEDFMKIIERDYYFTQVGSYFSMAFTVFIICHELSHHILGHSTKKRAFAIPENNGESIEIPINSPSIKEEFEADSYAYKLYLELIKNRDKIKVAQLTEAFNRAPLVFFELMDIVQTYAEYKTGQSFKSDSHPHPQQRKERLMNQYDSGLHHFGEEFYKGFMGYSAHIRKKIKRANLST